MTDLKKSQHPILWLNLIAYNGYCYQSYGPIGAFSSFEPDDIYFFATEIDLGILDEADLLVKLDNNPLPYMMLLSGANYPLIVHQKDQLVHLWSEYQIEQLDCQDLRNRFKSEYNQGIYRFSLKNWSDHPHFVQAYYTEHSGDLVLTAHTDRGYAALICALRKYDLELEDEAHIRIKYVHAGYR